MRRGLLPRWFTSTVLSLGLTVAATAHAEDLDKKQASLLSRATNEMGMLEKSLERYLAGTSSYTDRLVGENQKKLDRIEEKLKDLPATNDDVKRELAHFEEVKKKVGELSAKLSGSKQAAADEKDAIIKLLAAPECAGDLETIKAFGERFLGAQRYDLDYYVWRQWPGHGLVVEMKADSAAWPETKKKLDELLAKYGRLLEYRKHIEGEPGMKLTEVQIALREAKDRFPDYDKAVQTFLKEAPAALDKAAAALKEASKTAVDKQQYQAFTSWESPLMQHRFRVDNLAAIWAPMASSEDERKKIEARAKAIDEEMEAAAQKLAEAIIRENRAPKDVYAKGDKAELERFIRGVWAKKFPAESIVAVRFPHEAFERKTQWVYVPDSRAFVKRDRSTMGAWVIVKDGPKQAIQWYVTVIRQHLKGDALDLDWIDRPSKVPPMQRMLLANFK